MRSRIQPTTRPMNPVSATAATLTETPTVLDRHPVQQAKEQGRQPETPPSLRTPYRSGLYQTPDGKEAAEGHA